MEKLVFLIFVPLLSGTFGFSPSDKPLTTIEYEGEQLPIWYSNGIVYTTPIPTFEPAETKFVGDSLQIGITVTNDEYKRLVLNAVRKATGQCIKVTNIQIAASVLTKISLDLPTYQINITWPSTVTHVSLPCPATNCHFLKAAVNETNLKYTLKYMYNNVVKENSMRKAKSVGMAKEISCELSRLLYLVERIQPTIEKGKCLQFENSLILLNHEKKEKLMNLLGPVVTSGVCWKKCFTASHHNFQSSKFHSNCDNKGPTITVVRVGSQIFGGYTDKSWSSKDGFISSSRSMIFSLTKNTRMMCIVPQTSIYGGIKWGPIFGGVVKTISTGYGTKHDVYVANKCNSNTKSYSMPGHSYKLPAGITGGSTAALNFLAGSRNFKCDDYEVFYST